MKTYNYARLCRPSTSSFLDLHLYHRMPVDQICGIVNEYYPTWELLNVNNFEVKNEQVDQTG
jgi:hypothetical protein